MVFADRQLQEKCQEQNIDLYSTYVDLTKAFASVSRYVLWRVMRKYRCPDKFITACWRVSRTTEKHQKHFLSRTE